MKNLVTLAAVTLILIGATVRPTAAQVVNGSFENGQDPGVSWLFLSSGSNVMDGWLVSFGTVEYIGGWWQASDGVRSIDMNGNTRGQISQSIVTTPGETYDMSGNPDGPPVLKQLTVTADGGQAQSFSYDTSLAGTTRADMRWETKKYTFTATGSITLLAFTSDVEGWVFGPALDNVRLLENVEPPTEEPIVCHRNFGKKGHKTLLVSPLDVPAHLAHGDTEGPCV
jgi:choice-of-anchor C domain-containing protein